MSGGLHLDHERHQRRASRLSASRTSRCRRRPRRCGGRSGRQDKPDWARSAGHCTCGPGVRGSDSARGLNRRHNGISALYEHRIRGVNTRWPSLPAYATRIRGAARPLPAGPFRSSTNETSRDRGIPPHQAPAALRLRRGQPAEGGGASSRGRHHRSRHGQSRHRYAQAHRRQADRDGAAAAHAPLFGVQGHSGPAQGAGGVLCAPVRREARPGDPGRRHARAPRKASPTWRRRSARPATS